MSEAIRRLLWALAPAVICMYGQSTDGIILGRIIAPPEQPLAGASVTVWSQSRPVSAVAQSGGDGSYVLPPLPPGMYRVEVTLAGHQPADLSDIELPVGGYLELNFELRPLASTWETKQYRRAFLDGRYVIHFYGPDVAIFSRYWSPPHPSSGSVEATLSSVIDPFELRDLPLAGRDAYTMLLTQPGVSADTATARGAGVYVNGQRAYSSNFLLDGVEANRYLLSGPLLAIAPEALQEYRVSTNSWSAEYGSASGVIANAVTASGGSAWHGIGYLNVNNQRLNANGFADNAQGRPRRPYSELQPGFHAGGPLVPERLFISTALEGLHSRGRRAPVDLLLPSTEFVNLYTAEGSAARSLLSQFRPLPATDGLRPAARTTADPPVTIDRTLALERIDLVRGRERVMARLAMSRVSRPDFIWSPYSDFVSGMDESAQSLAFAWVNTSRANLVHEIRVGWTRSTLAWDRAHREIPMLATAEGVLLPGSPAAYAYRNAATADEVRYQGVWTRSRHIVKFGGSALRRRNDGYLTLGRDGFYEFGTILDFAIGRPRTFSTTVSRAALPELQQPEYGREFALLEGAVYVQDTFRVTPRFTWNLGSRWEKPAAPSGRNDATVALGSGSTVPERLAAAHLEFPRGEAPLYPSGWTWSPRAGFSFALDDARRILLRGAFGIYHDRMFDNAWQNLRNNAFVLKTYASQGTADSYLRPVGSVLPLYANRASADDFPPITFFDPDWKTPYARSFFLGVERSAGAWSVDVNFNGSQGRRLMATDLINRPFSLAPADTASGNPDRVYNPELPLIAYRSNLAESDYYALTARAAARMPTVHFQVAYTWGHVIDNQSDPLAGDYFDLDFTRLRPAADRPTASFSRQFDARTDRGSADFDQRQNVVLSFVLENRGHSDGFPARVLRHWIVSGLAAVRSGFPYSVLATSTVPESGGAVYNNRADLIDTAHALAHPAADVPGGKRLLNAAAFAQPAGGKTGNLGRNTFTAPGFFNMDAGLARSFSLPWLRESARLTVRADALNVFNHANLDRPDAALGSATFGVATFGRRTGTSGFPAIAPLEETGRQLQILLRFEF